MNKKFPSISKEIVEIKIIKKDIAVIDEKIDNNQKAVLKQLEANSVVFGDKLTLILEQTQETNGRVTKLEKNWITKEEFNGLKSETKLVRFFQNNKIIFFITLYGLYNLFQIFSIEKIIKLIF